ncbi:MAG: tetratricopeptide repeat protein [Hyphomicrobiales bacterium]|nr:tetratricopeptide repeat protein [Hyphomicrobiales bacterium]
MPRSDGSAILGLTAAAFGLVVLASHPVFAEGGGGGGTDVVECRKGLVYDKEKKKCVPAQSGVTPDAVLTEYAYFLAKAGKPEEALSLLDMVQDQQTSMALNYRGYATRLTGKVDEGIVYYKQALAIDPGNVLVREYLGEAYVSKGKIAMARAQLRKIEELCGNTTCEQCADLAEEIEKAETKG